jgi:hypothetical protein
MYPNNSGPTAPDRHRRLNKLVRSNRHHCTPNDPRQPERVHNAKCENDFNHASDCRNPDILKYRSHHQYEQEKRKRHPCINDALNDRVTETTPESRHHTKDRCSDEA